MSQRKYYGIKFPITVESDKKHLLDLNTTAGESITSRLMHLIFTPKGQMLRNANFGTNLIKFIFNPNDQQTENDILEEIKNAVNEYIPTCVVNSINVDMGDTEQDIVVKINYFVKEEDGRIISYTTKTKL